MTKVNNFSGTANDSIQISASANEKGIQIFNNQEFGNLGVIEIDNETWFLAKDVTRILGYANPSDAIKDNVDADECKVLSYKAFSCQLPFLWGNNDFSNKVLISESGIYTLILSSKLASAKRFRKWVTSEVLPSIRKHGMYATDATIDKILADPDFGIRLLVQLKEERAARIEAEAKIKEDAPKVEFYDAVTDSKDAIDMRSVATTLNMGIGRNKIFEILRNEKILDRKNIPYQKYIDMGYFRTVETSYSKPSGDTCINIKTVVFQKGLDFIRKVINRHRK